VTQIVGPDMTIAKTHTGNFLRPQTGATYTITVTNSGAGNTFAPVTVTDSLPAGLSATAISGTNWTCTVTPLRCSRSDVLTAGNSYEPITVTVNVSNSAATSVTNTATVSGGGELNTANDTSSDVTQVDPVLQLSLQSPSVAVVAGGTASTTFNVIYTGGLGNVTFTCSGQPAGTACSFNPTSVSATGTTPVTLQIMTTGPSAALGPGPLGIPQQITAMLALLGLGGLVLAGPKQRRIRLAMGLASLVLLALAGCGGNSVQPPKGGGTPLGAFQVTVTASTATGGATATGTVTLLVQ
jgi:uncharacterized repeat protein (TIGR01451 family)